MISLREKKQKIKREEYQRNRERYRAYNKKYAEGHKDKLRQYHKEYWSKEENKEKRRQYYQDNKEHFKKRDRIHYYKTRDRHRELYMATRYKISVEEYRDLFKRYDNKCAICRKPEKAIDKRLNVPRWLAVDHDHKTGKVRGLLCQNCNNALGHIHEDISLLDKIREYLNGKN